MRELKESTQKLAAGEEDVKERDEKKKKKKSKFWSQSYSRVCFKFDITF